MRSVRTAYSSFISSAKSSPTQSVDGQSLLTQKRAEYATYKGAQKERVSQVRGEGAFSLLTARLQAPSVAETDSAEIVPAISKPTPNPTKSEETTRVYPSLVTAWLREGETSAGRAWLLLRHLDPQGRGWLDSESVRDQLTHKTSPYKICGRRRLRQIINDGDGIFWKVDRERQRIWLHGAGAVAQAFKVERLHGRNVAMPLSSLLNGIATVRAYFYASFHASRKSAPITRTTLETVTGVSERSQRRYDQLSGVLRKTNISIEEKRTVENAESHTWKHGQASFAFYDTQGRQGKPHTLYNARRLPNSYHAPLERGTTGRKRRINRRLDLVTQRAQGNETERYQRLFYRDAKGVVAKVESGQSAYYQTESGTCQAQGKGEVAFWMAVGSAS